MSLRLDQYDDSLFDAFIDTPDLHEYLLENGQQIHSQLRADILTVIRTVMRPRESMRVDQCADEYRHITRTSSATPGKFEVSEYEVARGPLAAVTEPGVRKITAVGPTQLYKSTLLECTALYYAIIDPKPVILVQPCFKDAIDFMHDKMKPMFEVTPAVAQRVYHTTKSHVMYTGGQLSIASASSENSLASRLAAVMLFDEPSKYALLGGRHPVSYGDKRLETYGVFGKSIRASSPKTEDNFIWTEYLQGDRRQAFVVCPHCGHDHVMRWRSTDAEKERHLLKHGVPARDFNVVWEKDDDTGDWDFDSARYVCPECSIPWTNGERLNALAKYQVKWRQTKPFTCCRDHEHGGYQDPLETRLWTPTIDPTDGFEIVGRATCRVCGKLAVSNSHASFQTSRLYSPKHLSLLVEKWKAALAVTGGIQDFVNDELGEPFRDLREIQLTADGLRARDEHFEFELPDRCVLITVGVDSHPDRFEYEFVGWGRHGESWSLDYGITIGPVDDPYTLSELNRAILEREFVGRDGRKIGVSAMCIDSGGTNEEGVAWTTKAVYEFSAQRQEQNVWAIKGAPEKGERIWDPWPKSPTTANALQVPLFTLGTTALKNEVWNMLSISVPGPKYCHFRDDRDMSWYTGLLGERKIKKGSVWRWKIKDGARNEPFDARVYALAALEGLRWKYRNPFLVEELADSMGIRKDMTQAELEHFSDEMLDRIEEQTGRSIEQGRAKPINKRVVNPKLPKKDDDRNPKIPERPKPTPLVATIVPVAVESEPSGQYPNQGQAGSPGRRTVPWDRKR